MILTAIPSDNFVIAVEAGQSVRKVMRVTFSGFDSDDPAIFVQWPYYRETHGVLSIVTAPPGRDSQSLSLKPGGRLTSHDVKYAHHADGEAHFSQDGKIRTQVRKHSVPLGDCDDHLFTCQIQGLNDFAEAVPGRDLAPATRKRSVIRFGFPNDEPSAIKIVGYWRLIRTLELVGNMQALGPQIALRSPDGEFHRGFILSPPRPKQATHVLLLSCEEIPSLDKSNYSCFSMIGGFDPPNISRDPDKATSFLAATYPTDDPSTLLREIGTVDLT